MNDELELLRRLRQLPREREPAQDLWQGIGARLDATSRAATRPAPSRRAIAGGFGLAAAASLLLALGLAWRVQQPESTTPVTDTAVARDAAGSTRPVDSLLRREADAITLEYELALQPYETRALPQPLQAAATELDSSARELRQALREQPDAAYLLDRLRHTYDQRLKLTQRALLG